MIADAQGKGAVEALIDLALDEDLAVAFLAIGRANGDDAAVAAPRVAYWRAVRNRVVNLEMIGAQFLGQP